MLQQTAIKFHITHSVLVLVLVPVKHFKLATKKLTVCSKIKNNWHMGKDFVMDSNYTE